MVSSANFAPLSGNYIADILISEGTEAVFRKNSKIKFKKNDIIYQSAYSIGKLYFPIDMIVSFVCDLSSGYSAEFMQIGCDGVVGISAIMGGGATINTAIAQTSGTAYRVDAAIIQQVFDNSPNFRRTILKYMQALMQESAQRIVCYRHHSVLQQLCRTLLMAANRLRSEKVSLTHEQLALAIGCRREAISVAAGKIQAAGLIDYAYGRITIRDRAGLEACCCECYEVIRRAFSDFLPSGSGLLGADNLQGGGNDG